MVSDHVSIHVACWQQELFITTSAMFRNRLFYILVECLLVALRLASHVWKARLTQDTMAFTFLRLSLLCENSLLNSSARQLAKRPLARQQHCCLLTQFLHSRKTVSIDPLSPASLSRHRYHDMNSKDFVTTLALQYITRRLWTQR